MTETSIFSEDVIRVDALDLPQLHTRPCAEVLIRTLDGLAIKPSTFDGIADGAELHNARGAESGVPRYLTGIISSQLGWIEDDTLKERIWELASIRLSERSGRSAMPSVTRVFAIPVTTSLTKPKATIVLREPSLTGDNLGHKTWAASYLLAKRLALLTQYLPPFSKPEDPTRRVLELGGGTGLVGISAAAILSAPVALTDLPEICSNLAYNCQANESTIASYGGSTNVFPLDWSEPSTYPSHKYDLILAADSLYSPGHPELLANAIAALLAKTESARVVVELPVREAYQPEVKKFRELIVAKGLDLMREGDEVGYDDWDDGAKEVVCWWSMWGWKE